MAVLESDLAKQQDNGGEADISRTLNNVLSKIEAM